MKPLVYGLIFFTTLVIATGLSIWLGPVDLTSAQILETIRGEGPPENLYIVREIRGPRTILAIMVGGGLALAGAVFKAAISICPVVRVPVVVVSSFRALL